MLKQITPNGDFQKLGIAVAFLAQVVTRKQFGEAFLAARNDEANLVRVPVRNPSQTPRL
jgi:hypothetical protein